MLSRELQGGGQVSARREVTWALGTAWLCPTRAGAGGGGCPLPVGWEAVQYWDLARRRRRLSEGRGLPRCFSSASCSLVSSPGASADFLSVTARLAGTRGDHGHVCAF